MSINHRNFARFSCISRVAHRSYSVLLCTFTESLAHQNWFGGKVVWCYWALWNVKLELWLVFSVGHKKRRFVRPVSIRQAFQLCCCSLFWSRFQVLFKKRSVVFKFLWQWKRSFEKGYLVLARASTSAYEQCALWLDEGKLSHRQITVCYNK